MDLTYFHPWFIGVFTTNYYVIESIYYIYRIRSALEESDDSKVVLASAYPEILAAPTLLTPANDTTNLEINVHFDLRGREWNEKYFTNLNAWKVDRVSEGSAPVSNSAPSQDTPPTSEEDDDLPF